MNEPNAKQTWSCFSVAWTSTPNPAYMNYCMTPSRIIIAIYDPVEFLQLCPQLAAARNPLGILDYQGCEILLESVTAVQWNSDSKRVEIQHRDERGAGTRSHLALGSRWSRSTFVDALRQRMNLPICDSQKASIAYAIGWPVVALVVALGFVVVGLMADGVQRDELVFASSFAALASTIVGAVRLAWRPTRLSLRRRDSADSSGIIPSPVCGSTPRIAAPLAGTPIVAEIVATRV